MTIKENEVFELQTPEHVISLATSGMLVSTDVNVWSATKQDRAISSEVTTRKRATEQAGRFVKNLLAGNKQHTDVKNYRQTIYNWQKRRTLRWNNSQDYILSVDFEDFMSEWSQHRREFNRLLDNFCMKYDDIKSKMAFEQGDMYDRDDYPSVEQVRQKFGCELYVSDVPEGDPRVEISHDLAKDLKDNLSRQYKTRIDSMISQQIELLVGVMESISTCCGTEDRLVKGITQTRNRKMNENTLNKAKDYCSKFKQYTLADTESNTKLKSVIKLLDNALNGVDITALRESDVVRDNVKSNIDDILSKFDF